MAKLKDGDDSVKKMCVERRSIGEKNIQIVPLVKISWQGTNELIKDRSLEKLSESIRRWGVLVPIGVYMSDDGFIGIYGRRRYVASELSCRSDIPAYVYEGELSEDLISAMRLIENFQRNDPDPISAGMACYKYLEAKLGVNSIPSATGKLQLFGRNKRRLDDKDVEAISTLEKVSRKSYRTLENMINLLQLPEKMKKAIEKREIKPTTGYLFAKHLDNPKLESIFHFALECNVSKDDLEKRLSDSDDNSLREDTKDIKKCMANIERIKAAFDENIISNNGAKNILSGLMGLCALIEKRMLSGDSESLNE